MREDDNVERVAGNLRVHLAECMEQNRRVDGKLTDHGKLLDAISAKSDATLAKVDAFVNKFNGFGWWIIQRVALLIIASLLGYIGATFVSHQDTKSSVNATAKSIAQTTTAVADQDQKRTDAQLAAILQAVEEKK